jgi:hypothetical protein
MEATVDRGWRKSSYSGNGGQCVEVADDDSRVFVRDSQDSKSPILRFTPDAWRRLVKQIQQSLASSQTETASGLIPGAV